MSSSQPPHPDPGATIISGEVLLGWVQRGVSVLALRREEINSLNVFPVPDSDTGSNMLATLDAALEAARQVEPTDAREVTAALAAGAVRGARGNSGTVLSQVFRALAETASAAGINADAVRRALRQAVGHVSQAIANPVEGTILTVLRHAAVAAQEYRGASIAELIADIAAAARRALGDTPSQLPALREAGVVDAGGAGLVLLLDALADELSGSAAPPPDLHVETAATPGPEMEVMYVISLPQADSAAQLRERLSTLGNSVIVAGDASESDAPTYMVHVHTTDPGAAIEAALDFGRPAGIRIEVLEEVHDGAASANQPRVVLTAVPEGPLVQLVAASGAQPLEVAPRQSLSSEEAAFTEDMVTKVLTAMHSLPEHTDVILLPNGLVSGAKLVQIEMDAAAGGHPLTIVPTDTIAAGLAALAVYDPEQPTPVTAYAMGEAARGIRVSTISATDTDIAATTITRARSLLADNPGELVTVLLGNSADAAIVDSLRSALAADYPLIDVIAYAADGIDDAVQLGIE